MYVWLHSRTIFRNMSDRLYMYVFWLYMPVYVCMISYISIYKQIQTVIFVHMLCYICIYLWTYSFIYAHIAHMCAYFLQPNPWVEQYEHVWAHIYIYEWPYAYICTNTYIIHAWYMQYTGMFFVHAARYMSKLILYKYVYACICIYDVYTCMYIWGEFIRACIGTNMYVYACICLYLRHMPVRLAAAGRLRSAVALELVAG